MPALISRSDELPLSEWRFMGGGRWEGRNDIFPLPLSHTRLLKNVTVGSCQGSLGWAQWGMTARPGGHEQMWREQRGSTSDLMPPPLHSPFNVLRCPFATVPQWKEARAGVTMPSLPLHCSQLFPQREPQGFSIQA